MSWGGPWRAPSSGHEKGSREAPGQGYGSRDGPPQQTQELRSQKRWVQTPIMAKNEPSDPGGPVTCLHLHVLGGKVSQQGVKPCVEGGTTRPRAHGGGPSGSTRPGKASSPTPWLRPFLILSVLSCLLCKRVSQQGVRGGVTACRAPGEHLTSGCCYSLSAVSLVTLMT